MKYKVEIEYISIINDKEFTRNSYVVVEASNVDDALNKASDIGLDTYLHDYVESKNATQVSEETLLTEKTINLDKAEIYYEGIFFSFPKDKDPIPENADIVKVTDVKQVSGESILDTLQKEAKKKSNDPHLTLEHFEPSKIEIVAL